MWDYYDKAMKEAEAGPVLVWYGDHQVEMEPEVPATPDVPRPPSRQPRLTDYVDMGEVEVVFNRRRSSGQLAVPDLPAESPHTHGYGPVPSAPGRAGLRHPGAPVHLVRSTDLRILAGVTTGCGAGRLQ